MASAQFRLNLRKPCNLFKQHPQINTPTFKMLVFSDWDCYNLSPPPSRRMMKLCTIIIICESARYQRWTQMTAPPDVGTKHLSVIWTVFPSRVCSSGFCVKFFSSQLPTCSSKLQIENYNGAYWSARLDHKASCLDFAQGNGPKLCNLLRIKWIVYYEKMLYYYVIVVSAWMPADAEVKEAEGEGEVDEEGEDESWTWTEQ